MGNQAIRINPDTNRGGHANIAITTRGSDWYFTVCAVMTFSTLIFWGLAFRKHPNRRIFYYITAGITLVAAIAYFTEGSNLGWTPIRVEFLRSDPKVRGLFRQVFYVRYIDYFVTLPLILLDLLLTAAIPWPTILYTILINWVMVVCLLVGALVRTSYKWGYFGFSTAAFLFIAYTVLWPARRHAAALGGSIYRTYLTTGVWIFFLWMLYPIAWGVSEGGNIISPNSEAIFYGIIDLLAKPVFGAMLLWGHGDIDQEQLGIDVRDPVNPNAHPPPSSNGFSSGHKHRLGSLGSLLHRRDKAAEAGALDDHSTGVTNTAASPMPAPLTDNAAV